MKSRVPKIIVCLLLPIFVLTCAGDVFGLVWCIGEDGHFSIERSMANDCADGARSCASIAQDEAMLAAGDPSCGPCLDLFPEGDAFLIKRLKKSTPASTDVTSPETLPLVIAQSIKLVVGGLTTKPTPRVSQTILAHRTVVLLH